jgi:capsular polysaccharide transport system permease protein
MSDSKAPHRVPSLQGDADGDRAVVESRAGRGSARLREAADISIVPPAAEGRSYGALLSFVAFVLVPVALAIAYFGHYASNQYAVEFKFSVRDSRSTVSPAGGGSALSAILGVTTAPNGSETYMVVDYMQSRQAVADLSSTMNLREMYSRPAIDRWARFDAAQPVELFVAYWRRMITAGFDQVTGIATARVKAFTPEDAHRIAVALLANSEEVLNKTANRPILDAVKFAEIEVKRAEERLKEIRAELAIFRNTEKVIDPNANTVASNTALVTQLKTTLSDLQTELATLGKRGLSPTAPAMVALRTRIDATNAQLTAVEAQVSTDTHGNPLSGVVGRFEELDLDRQFAQNAVLATNQALENARSNALSQRIYVNTFVAPAVPQGPAHPKRGLSIALVAIVCFMFWTIGLLVSRSIREHGA